MLTKSFILSKLEVFFILFACFYTPCTYVLVSSVVWLFKFLHTLTIVDALMQVTYTPSELGYSDHRKIRNTPTANPCW